MFTMGNTNFGPEAFYNRGAPMAFVCGPIGGWDLRQNGDPWPDGEAPAAMQIAVELSHRGRVFATGGPGEILRDPDPGPWGLALRILDRRVAQAATGRLVVATGTKSYPDEAGPFDDEELTWTEEIRFNRIRTRGGRDIETQGISGEGGAGLILATSGALLAGLVKRRNQIARPEMYHGPESELR